MDKIGKSVPGALVPFDKNSAPAAKPIQRYQRVITPPARVDHFADVAIPNRVWSAFGPAGGEPRMLIRALMESERLTLERRVAVLEPAMVPFDASERDRVADAVLGMIDSFTAGPKGEGSAAAKADGTMEVLADMPAWAIEEACLSIRRYGWKDADGKLQQHWAPSDPEIHAIVDKLIDGRRTALVNAKTLLSAPLEPAALERAAASIDSSLADFKAKMSVAEASDLAQEESRRQERSARDKERSLQDRRQDYINAGIEPPPAKFGFLTSLPMMLQQGWTIETVDEVSGKRVLVSPKKVPA